MATIPSSYVPYQVIEPVTSNVRHHLLPYLKNWHLYLLSLILALTGAYVYLLFKQPIYRIGASIMLQDEKKGNTQTNPLKELEVYSPKKVVENELEVLRSASLMGRVVDDLHLNVRYFRDTRFGKREIYTESPVSVFIESANPLLFQKSLVLTFPSTQSVRLDEQTYPLNQRINTPYGQLRVLARKPLSKAPEAIVVQVLSRSGAIGLYQSSLKAEPTSKSSTVIRLTLEDAVPQKGEAVLNYLIQEYNQAAEADKNQVSASTLRFVEERLRGVAGELTAVEKNVERYKSTHSINDLSAQAQSFLQTVQQNDAELNQITIQLASVNELQKFVKNSSASRGTTPATVGLNDPVLLGQIDQLSKLQLQRDQLSRTTPDENPILQTIDSQIKVTRDNIGQNIETMKTMLTSSRQQYVSKNGQVNGQIRMIPQQERALMNVSREQAVKNNLYNYLLQKREELAVSFAASIADTRTIDAAESSGTPVKPVGMVIYALFGLVGLLLPTMALAGKSALNTRVIQRFDVEGVTQVPILGEVMQNRHRGVLVVAPNNRTVIAEQIRIIRTNLFLSREDNSQGQVILFTSSLSGEGKSFVSLNLGASMAMLRQPTVILEMDLRMPRLHQEFNFDNSAGISNYLNGELSLDDILKPVPGYPNYYIIPSGPLPPDPSELLSAPSMNRLITELRERFEYILIDAPPIGIVTDAQVLAPLADATLFVVRHGVTPKQSLKILDMLHRQKRFKNLSIILNAVGDSDAYHFNNRYKNTYLYK